MFNTQTHNNVQFLRNTSVTLLGTYVFIVPLFSDSMTMPQKLLETFLNT